MRVSCRADPPPLPPRPAAGGKRSRPSGERHTVDPCPAAPAVRPPVAPASGGPAQTPAQKQTPAQTQAQAQAQTAAPASPPQGVKRREGSASPSRGRPPPAADSDPAAGAAQAAAQAACSAAGLQFTGLNAQGEQRRGRRDVWDWAPNGLVAVAP